MRNLAEFKSTELRSRLRCTGIPIGQHLRHDKDNDVVRFFPSGESVALVGGNGNIYLWETPVEFHRAYQVITLQVYLRIHIHYSLYLTDKPC